MLLLVARQNGKTELPVLLSTYWQFHKKYPVTLGTSTKLQYAKESWNKARKLVMRTRWLDEEHEPGKKWYRQTNGEIESWSVHEARYLIAPANEEGGRSLTVNRGVADELRQHFSYEAWEAMEPACSLWDSQIWALSNAGSRRSVVLNEMQDSARDHIETGEGDYRLGLIEYSAPPGSELDDPQALLQANPRTGWDVNARPLEDLINEARRKMAMGGAAAAGFRTEKMCIRVDLDDPAIDPDDWALCLDPAPIADRSRLALCFDVSPALQHASLYAATVLPGGRVRVEGVQAWEGRGCVDRAVRELPALVAKVKPRAFGWLPSGPAAAAGAQLAERKTPGALWPPRGVTAEEIRGETTQVCMGLASLVTAHQLAHSGDPLLDDNALGAEKAPRGDAWVFSRKSDGDVDALYAAGGAAFLAQTLPVSSGRMRVLLPKK
ncbi:terminase [Paractinoplanes hotanensis]|uniref:Terminase n=1 Tax=Paractinoplanes hotanensis TaxID=2906497 RepID=A0ABT0Y316_9ACTN|nr:terminase [Actinoplanes hotanensis]MCM4080416.1 terminase [Actinoplanes hotanensis]